MDYYLVDVASKFPGRLEIVIWWEDFEVGSSADMGSHRFSAEELMVERTIGRTASLGSPGVENIRWLKPVRPGDTIGYRRTVGRGMFGRRPAA